MKPFKNFVVYKLTRDIDFSDLPSQLESCKFQEIPSGQLSTIGFIPNVVGEDLHYGRLGFHLLSIKKEEKIIPSAYLKKELEKRVAKFEEMTGNKVKKSERDSFKDEVLQSLIPTAFTKEKVSRIIIDTLYKFVIVEAGSHNAASDLIALVRKAIGSLPVVHVDTTTPVDIALTEWAADGEGMGQFMLGTEATLKSVMEDGGELKCKKQEIISDEIHNHIEAGKRVTSLSLIYGDSVLFTLNDDLRFTKVKFTDLITEQNDDYDKEDVQGRFNADFVLYASEMRKLIKYTLDSLGEK